MSRQQEGSTVYERDGRYMAPADLAEDSRDIGVGDTPQAAVRAELDALGEPSSSDMAEGVEGEPRWTMGA